MSDLFHLLEDISGQLPGCQMASIVDLESGMQLACVSESDSAATSGADAYQSELYRRASELVSQLGSDGEIETVVLESDGATFVCELIGDSGYFWHVATEAETTLGFTQAIMRKYRDRVLDGVRDLVGE